MQYTKIKACASYVPESVVDNFQLSEILNTSDEWITTRTGIKKRRISNFKNTSDFCINVAKELLLRANVAAKDLDFIIVATMTGDYACPSTACLVQGAIGATNALAFDISAACAGFIYALSTADKFIRTGSNCGLVIGGETLSKIIDWQDRKTAVLFGDAAGGVLVTKASRKYLLAENLQADGTRANKLTAGFIPPNSPFSSKMLENTQSRFLQMDGRTIFDFAVRDVTRNILETLQKVNLTSSDIDYYLLHQANIRLIGKIARKIDVPFEKFLHNIENFGNTSAASLPLLLAEKVEAGILPLDSGKKVVLTGFGGGLSWGTLIFEL